MVRIATFNLLDFFDARDDAERDVVGRKRRFVGERVRAVAPDVIALQEVGSTRLLHETLEGLGYDHAVFGPVDRRGIGCGIVSRRPFLSTEVHTAEALGFPRFVESDPDPFAGRISLRRGVVQATVDAGELGAVDVLTIHFKSKLASPMKTAEGNLVVDASSVGYAESVLRSLVARTAEALYLRRLIDRLLGENADRMLCALGDFNDTLGSLPLQIVCGMGATLGGALSSCTLDVADGYTVYHAGEREQIDHILASPTLLRRRFAAGIENHDLRDHGPHVPEAPLADDSDHALVWADFA